MSRNNGNGDGGWSRKLELNLNLSPSPPAAAAERMEVDDGQDIDDSSNYSSSPRSCMSSDSDDSPGGGGTEPSLVIGACERCLMYCMVPKEEYPTCINCKQPCLIDVLPAAGDDKKGGTGQ